MTELPVENIEESEDNSRHTGPGGPGVDAIMAPENEVKIDSVIAKETSNEVTQVNDSFGEFGDDDDDFGDFGDENDGFGDFDSGNNDFGDFENDDDFGGFTSTTQPPKT